MFSTNLSVSPRRLPRVDIRFVSRMSALAERLVAACGEERPAMADLLRLLDEGASVNERNAVCAPPTTSSQDSLAPLHAAAHRGSDYVIELLLRRSANPEIRNEVRNRARCMAQYGWTSLHLAAQSGHVSAVSSLLRGGAAVNALSPVRGKLLRSL